MNENENNPYYQNMNGGAAAPKTASGLSVAALVLSVISIVTCFFFINIPLGIIAIILAIVSLIKKKGGKGLSIIAMILSIISLLMSVLVTILIWPLLKVLPDLYRDMTEIYNNYDAVIQEYDRTGELPEYMDEYYEGEIGEFFDEYYGGFDNFFNNILRLD